MLYDYDEPFNKSNPDNPYSRSIFDIFDMEFIMNKEQIQGKGTQLKGKLKETFGRLTDDELSLYEGQRDQFFGSEAFSLLGVKAEVVDHPEQLSAG